MNTHFEALSNNTHKSVKITRNPCFPHAKEQHIVPIAVSEIAKLATCYPICFIKDEHSGQFKLAALLGVNIGENLFYNKTKWQAPYIPLHIQKAPFVISEQKDNNYIIGIDMQSSYVSESEGVRIFDDNGNETEALTGVKALLEHLVDQEHVTQTFINKLSELGLLSHYKLRYSLPNGEQKELNGLYSVDEELLKTLTDEQSLSLHKKGYLAAINAHLLSIGQFKRLFNLKDSAA